MERSAAPVPEAIELGSRTALRLHPTSSGSSASTDLAVDENTAADSVSSPHTSVAYEVDENGIIVHAPSSHYPSDDEHETEVQVPLKFDRDLRTRNLCALALILGWTIAIISLVLGAGTIVAGRSPVPSFLAGKIINFGYEPYPFPTPPPGFPQTLYYFEGHRVVEMSQVATILVSLLLNIGLTLIFDSMNYIHVISLKWALLREGKRGDIYNSLPRLWTTAEQHATNSWFTNLVSATATVIAYGSISLLSMKIYIVGAYSVDMTQGTGTTKEDITGPRYGLDLSAWGFVGLGIGLGLQASVTTFCLCKSKQIGCFSSNVLSTAKACVATCPEFASQARQRRAGASRTARPAITPQRSAYDTIKQVPRLTYVVWALFVFVAVWTSIIGFIALRLKTNKPSFVESEAGRLDFSAYWNAYGLVGVRYAHDDWTSRLDWAALLIQSAFLIPFIVGLHAAETLVHLSRDELIWRKTATVGSLVDGSTLKEECYHWETQLLFGFKTVIPFILGSALSCNLSMFMALLPLCTLTFLCVLLAGFAEYVSRRQPKGCQPAIYGNIPLLIYLVDEWQHPRLFWGDKGEKIPGERLAGTSGRRLPDLDVNGRYVGLNVHEPVMDITPGIGAPRREFSHVGVVREV